MEVLQPQDCLSLERHEESCWVHLLASGDDGRCLNGGGWDDFEKFVSPNTNLPRSEVSRKIKLAEELKALRG